MNNHFGSPVLESFFLVIPTEVAIVKQSREYISRKRIGDLDVYLWQREVPQNTTNAVNVVLKKAKGDSRDETYVVTFRPVAPFHPTTSKELLDAFNENHPDRVRTHHYSTEKRGNILFGRIHVDTRAGKNALIKMLIKAPKLSLVKVKRADLSNPRVVATNPPAFADDVDPSLDKITATFDQPMRDRSWSWTGGGETFPELTGKPHYDATRKTCTLPVKLKAGQVYWVGINSPSYKNFKTPAGVPATRHVILFATAGADGAPTPIPEDLTYKAKAINGMPSETIEKAESKSHEPLRLGPAPWTDGEVMQLDLKSQVGMKLGTIFYTVESVKVETKDAWRVESHMTVPMSGMRQFTSVSAKRESFLPISAVTKNDQTGDFYGEYTQKGVTWRIDTPNKKDTRKVELEGVAYDNEQVLHMIRRMPLKEGYATSFPIFPLLSGVITECKINVNGKETITVPAGTFDCYKVDIRAGFPGGSIHQEVWFSSDEHRYFVKLVSNHVTMELVEVTVMKKNIPTPFKDPKLGILLTIPPGWFHYNDPAPMGGYKFGLHLLPPEMKGWSLLTAAPSGAVFDAPTPIAEADIEVLKGFFEGYTVREDSWASSKISGIPAAGYVADYQDKGKQMVEYRTYLLGKKMIYWFVFRIEKDDFAGKKPQFDTIVNSFTKRARPSTGPS